MSQRNQCIAFIATLLVLDVLFVAVDGYFGFPMFTDALGTIERHLVP